MDHDHKTGRFRGWLCPDCNFAIGSLHDSEDKILGLVDYLDSSNLDCFVIVPEKSEPAPERRIQRTKEDIARRVKEREVERSLGIPLTMMKRQPFPGFAFELRFKRSLNVARHAAKKNGILPCFASVHEVCGEFSGKCQNPGCCADESSFTKRLSLDHDHVTGKFRGWLCGSCNSALGMAKESKEILLGLIQYLKSSK